MATNLINANLIYTEEKQFHPIVGYNNELSAGKVGPWNSFLDDDFAEGAQYGISALNQGVEGLYLAGPQDGAMASGFPIGTPLPHVIRLSIVPTLNYNISEGSFESTVYNHPVWDGTYTEASWLTYEQMFAAGDPNAASFLEQNLVTVEGYWTIDAQKITISGWDGGAGSQVYFGEPDVDGQLTNSVLFSEFQPVNVTSIKQFRGTAYGGESVDSNDSLSISNISGGLIDDVSTDSWNFYLGMFGVFTAVEGEQLTTVDSMRVIGNISTTEIGNNTPDEQLDEAINLDGADSNLNELWPNKIKKVILIDSLGTDENGFGIKGNIVHVYIMHEIGQNVEWNDLFKIDFDGAAEFVVTDEDFIFTETDLNIGG